MKTERDTVTQRLTSITRKLQYIDFQLLCDTNEKTVSICVNYNTNIDKKLFRYRNIQQF
jgi:hypothetical protein